MPDNFAHYGESAGSRWVKTVKCDISRIFAFKSHLMCVELIISIIAKLLLWTNV
jgi:hypothetical protein